MLKFGKMLTAMVTPFDDELRVDYDRAAELANYLLTKGSDGLVIAGTTGESPTLTDPEKLQLCTVIRDAVGNDVTLIAGTGYNETAASIELTQAASELGVLDAVMLVGPYYNKPSQEGLFQHFRACAAVTDLPVIVYNVPGRTGKNIDADTVIRLACECDNIISVKEASGDFVQISRICAQTPDDFIVYCGADEITLPMLAVGAYGVISVVSHLVGPQMAQMIAAFDAKETKKAWEIHYQLLDMFDACFLTSGSPACVKRGMELCGFDCGGLRLPLVPATEKDTACILRVCQNLDLV